MTERHEEPRASNVDKWRMARGELRQLQISALLLGALILASHAPLAEWGVPLWLVVPLYFAAFWQVASATSGLCAIESGCSCLVMVGVFASFSDEWGIGFAGIQKGVFYLAAAAAAFVVLLGIPLTLLELRGLSR